VWWPGSLPVTEVFAIRDARTNRRIRAREVRVIGAAGEQLGIMPTEAALQRAQAEGLDLVEISPMAKPPVCKLMDYGKFKYETKKKASEAKKKQVLVQLKEVKLRPKTDEHDYGFKVKNVRRFLEEGNKARVTIMFRGREITHKDIGHDILREVAEDVKDVGIIEQAPRQEGRQMFMILAPNPKARAQLREQAAKAPASEKKAERPAGAPPPRPPPAPPAPAAGSAAPEASTPKS
jgi:translation initiation factor IF-3